MQSKFETYKVTMKGWSRKEFYKGDDVELIMPSEIKAFEKFIVAKPQRNLKGWTSKKKRQGNFLSAIQKRLSKIHHKPKKLMINVVSHWKKLVKTKRERSRVIAEKYFRKWRMNCGYKLEWTNRGCNCNRVWVSCNNNCSEQQIWIKE